MRKVTVSRMRERYAQPVLTFRITYVVLVLCAMWRYAYVETVEPLLPQLLKIWSNSCILLRDVYCLPVENFSFSPQEFLPAA